MLQPIVASIYKNMAIKKPYVLCLAPKIPKNKAVWCQESTSSLHVGARDPRKLFFTIWVDMSNKHCRAKKKGFCSSATGAGANDFCTKCPKLQTYSKNRLS